MRRETMVALGERILGGQRVSCKEKKRGEKRKGKPGGKVGGGVVRSQEENVSSNTNGGALR